ncbi:MAG TPA: carboxymuconolactone decarboxylase family protein [Gemmatimonadaceae bacterium]|nr:carboxymuconolactone decarboxylase family protein [Gemmatimonadaceae bacterium]
MTPGVEFRLDYAKASPDAYRAQAQVEAFVRTCGLEKSLIELVKIRASQLNGCGFCVDMHTKDARAAGETEQRIYVLSAWREAPFYTPRERAALAWAEALTLLASGPPDDALQREVRQHFDERELVNLTLAVIAINGWNRLAVPFHTEVGSYQPPKT